MNFEWQMCWEEGGRSEREATFFLLSCGAHDFLNCFTVQTLIATGHPHHKLWCGCGKTVKAVVRVRQNRAETQFCRNMEKIYTARRPAICLHAVFFWDFLSCGEACKSSHKFTKSQKMVTSANCGAGAAKQFKLWCGCGKTRQKLISAPKKK